MFNYSVKKYITDGLVWGILTQKSYYLTNFKRLALVYFQNNGLSKSRDALGGDKIFFPIPQKYNASENSFPFVLSLFTKNRLILLRFINHMTSLYFLAQQYCTCTGYRLFKTWFYSILTSLIHTGRLYIFFYTNILRM